MAEIETGTATDDEDATREPGREPHAVRPEEPPLRAPDEAIVDGGENRMTALAEHRPRSGPPVSAGREAERSGPWPGPPPRASRDPRARPRDRDTGRRR